MGYPSLRLALALQLCVSPLLAQDWAGVRFPHLSASQAAGQEFADLQRLVESGAAAGLVLAQSARVKQGLSPAGKAWVAQNLEGPLSRLPPGAASPRLNLDGLKTILVQGEQEKEQAQLGAESQIQADRLAGISLKDAVAAGHFTGANAPVVFSPAPVPKHQQDRLRQKEDLSGPGRQEELAELDALIKKYEGVLGEGAGPGHGDAKELKWASLERLKSLFGELENPPVAENPLPVNSPEHKRIEAALARVEAVQAELQGQVASRDAAAAMLGVADRVRSGALRERRGGNDMLEFRKNFARLSMVMDLSYSLNVIQSAEKALAGMQAALDAKLARVSEQRKKNAQGQQDAHGQQGRGEEWKAEAEASVAKDKERAEDFAKLSKKAGVLSKRIEDFRRDVSGLIAAIEARDKAGSADAASEYDRRLALLPELHRKLIHGSGSGQPGEVSALSLKFLREQSAELTGHLRQLTDADARLAGAPLEFAGAIIVIVPGIPAVAAYNPQISEVLRILAERKTHWKGLQADHQKLLDSVNAALDPGNQKRVPNDFGDLTPESLVVYESEQKALAASLGRTYDGLAAQADALASAIENGAPGVSLPRLSGRPFADLRDLLPAYVDELHAMTFPDTDAGYDAKMDKLSLVKLLPFIGDVVIRRLEADGTIKALEKPVREILPEAKARFTESVAALKAVVDDIAADEAYLGGGGDPQALIDRKRALLRDTLKPMMENMRGFIEGTLIPFQQDRIAQSDPAAASDGYGVLYKEKKSLLVKIEESLSRSLPWGLASGGAKDGDVAGARAEIEKTRASFLEYKDIVVDFQDQMRRRKDPNNEELEDVYGEPAPYSLVRRAAKYRAEKIDRAARINARAVEVGKILADMDGLFPGKYNLAARFKLPTDVRGDEGPARLRALADQRVLQDMAAEIKRIADEAAAAGSPELGLGGGGGLPGSGTQPPVTLPPTQQLALLGLEAVKRLVPTTATGAQGDSIAECMARFLFSDALVSSSDVNLRERIPMFETFLNKGDAAINEALADLDADSLWVGGDLSGGAAVLSRKISVYEKISRVAGEGAELFGLKAGWSAEGIQTVADVTGYYETVGEVYGSGNEALDAEEKAAKEMKDALKKKQDELSEQRGVVLGWLRQLNDPHESALRRVMDNVSVVQDKTKAVLEANMDWHAADKQFKAADAAVRAVLEALEKEQSALTRALEGAGDLSRLDPALAKRLRSVSPGGAGWLAAGARGPHTLVIPKGQFHTFLSQLFSSFEAESSARDIAALRDEILKNPMALSQLLPGSKMVEMGEGADGFYLVYQTELSTPGGLETTGQVTMGNVLKLGESNVSVIGHRFASPPDPVNAPYGDQGITVRVESLQGANWVNYLDVTFHKFIQDIPKDMTAGAQAQEARMMVFDDFAVMLANGKLYFGAAGFADFALQDTKDKPYYYGGNLKTKVKFTEVMSLNAEESVLFAKDPRKFLQTVNLDFTNYDPDLDRDWVISAEGEDKTFRRDKVGLGFDLQKALEGEDTFTMELYAAQVTGTDDIEQKSVGLSVIKGFAFDVGAVPVETTLSGAGELGEKYDAFRGRVSFNLPNQGLVLSAQGKILGDADTYFVELRKKLGTNTDAFVSYGSPYVGLNHRLTLGANTTFTLGELWRSVAGGAAKTLTGDEALAGFNKGLEEFFKGERADATMIAELEKVFAADVGRRLLSLEVGELSRDLQDLAKAGALLDNTRQRAMIGFVSNPVWGGTAELASAGGFQLGTQTELTMTKSQRALMEAKTASIYAHGTLLQQRLLELTKLWQETLAETVLARWELALNGWILANAGDPVLNAEANAGLIEARGRLRQALLRYNALTGRSPDEGLPFDALAPGDFEALLAALARALERPDRLARLLDLSAMKAPQAGFNLMDWIPWVERLTFTVGAQLSDILSSQAIGLGFSVRLPIHDPTAAHGDKALRLTASSTLLELAAQARKSALRARTEADAARSWHAQVEALRASGPAVRSDVGDAVRAGRNGLIPQHEVWRKLRRWHWRASTEFEARVNGSLAEAWALLDGAAAGKAPPRGGDAPRSLDEALESAVKGSESLEALAGRSAAARELLEASDRRFAKVAVDVNVGFNVTAAGIALIPAFGLTGLGVFPVLEVTVNPDELRSLSKARFAAEEGLYTRLGDKVSADTAVELFRQYADYRAAGEALALYDREILPGASGWELDRARVEREAVAARRRQAASSLNHLMGRPLEAPIRLDQDLGEALASLERRLAEAGPVEASRDVLASRLAVARSVEGVVDKNLRSQNIRVEPVSLIGRSLGRLVSALSGEGLASPELLALARHQTLRAERDLAAFEAGLPAARARLAFELAQTERELKELEGDRTPRGRLAAAALRHKLLSLRAARAALGGVDARPEAGTLPTSYADLRSRLRKAYADAAPSPDYGRPGEALRSEPVLEAHGNLRWYYARQSLAKEPIHKHFAEGWIEARLRSAATPPEALLALAKLQKEKADELYAAEQARAQASADMLLARIALAARLKLPRLARDLRSAASRLNIPDGAALLKLLPADAEDDLETVTREYLREAEELDIEVIRRLVFGGEGSGSLPQLRANVIAERMSYKGFSPVGAFGLFRGVWVGAAFLEAPDPQRIEKALQSILIDALRRELEQQDRVKTLALKLHSLMASVSDKIQGVESHRARLETARKNLAGAAVRVSAGLAPKEDLEAAQLEALDAHEDFIGVLYALRADFIALVTELQALGHETSLAQPALLVPPARPASNAREQLLSWWSRRLLDDDFAARQPEAVRKKLEGALGVYRQAKLDYDGLQQAVSFDAAERLDLLTRNDLQGKRERVERLLAGVLDELKVGDPRWTELMGFLRAEAAQDAAAAGADVVDLRGLRRSMDKGASLPPVYHELSALEDAAWAAKDLALAEMLKQELRPEDYVLRDKALDAYAKALIAFDERLAGALSSGLDAGDVRKLSVMFDLRESLKRRRDLLRHGRGLVVVDAAIELGQSRLRALAWSLDDPRELGPASEHLAFLRALRSRWIAKPDAVESLLLARKSGDYLTSGEAEKLRERGRIVDLGGTSWLLPETWAGKKPTTLDELSKAGASELVAGHDARRDAEKREETRKRRAKDQRELDAALSKSPFALTTGGKLSGTLDLDELRRLERIGRVLWFDKRGRALPALAARHRRPDEVTAYVQTGGGTEPAGRHPREETLPKDRWAKLELGRLGAALLLEEAKDEELASRRAGWLSLKLEGHAFTLDENGNVTAVFMEEGETKGKTVHKVSDLRLGLDELGYVVEAQGPGFSFRLGPRPAVRWIAGSPAALETDGRGRVLKLFMDADALEKESESWWLEDATGAYWKRTDRDLPPIYRLRRYVDPATGLPVSLGRSYLDRRLSEAEDELGDVGRWAYMPWNWPNIVLEIPRGIVKTPIEMITGRDPNQEGYIGRVYMYRGEGGATQNHGALGSILRVIDVLELLPDPVDRYLDPSQFPGRVNPDGSLLPGEWMHEKSPRTIDGRKNVKFGAGSLLREVRYAKEDREDARARIAGAFQGSVRRLFVETARGRSGRYTEATLDHATGRVAVEEALRRLGTDVTPEGTAYLSASPNAVAVDEMTASIEIGLGAEQQRRRAAALEEYLKELEMPSQPEDLKAVAANALALAADAAKPTVSLPGSSMVQSVWDGSRSPLALLP